MAFGLATWDPFSDLERSMRRGLGWPFRESRSMTAPPIEFTDEGDHYLVRCEIPGVGMDDVQGELNGDVLTLKGEKRETREVPAKDAQGERKALYSECFYGAFERSITLPDDFDGERIEARAEDGLVFVTIGKKVAQQPKRIEIGGKRASKTTH